ncbi:MAG: hypothetical protein Q9168_006609 [Polycauliona sp. 1 TL-2023]
MDPISIAAGTVGFASLALQLADTAKKLRTLCDRVRDAPTYVTDLLDESTFLQTVLQACMTIRLSKNNSTQSSLAQDATFQALHMCARVVAGLELLLEKLRLGLKSDLVRRRTWAAFQTVFSRSEISDIQSRMERAKSTLLICQQLNVENRL